MTDYVSYLYLSLPFIACYDNLGEGDDPPPPNPDPESDPDKKKKEKEQQSFTADDVNRIVQERLARDRQQREEKYKDLETRYEQLLQNKNLTDEDRQGLQEQLEDVRKQMRTKEQQAAHEKKLLQEQYESRVKELETAAQTWESRFRESTMARALMDAAIGHDAYEASQIVSLLRPMTKLQEQTDETTGKPTGQFITLIDFPTTNEKGFDEVIQGRPDEIVKRMKEISKYANLFKSNVVSGLGANSATGGLTPGSNGRIDVRKLTPQQYAKIRKENPELLGL
jgi:hypothetical protein